MLASIPSATLIGASGHPVTVEVHVGAGLPGYRLVGMPDAACRESRDRVRAAILSSGLVWPGNCITVNLAPSGWRKTGAGLDLAIALGVLVASEAMPAEAVAGYGFVGELGLDGTLRRVPGAAPMVAVLGDVTAVVPVGCRAEAVVAAVGEVRVASTLAEVHAALTTHTPWPDVPDDDIAAEVAPPPDLADVRGQPVARQALEIAAAGGHHLLLVGAPGSGKTMLAQRITGLLPALSPAEALAATMVHSAAALAMPGGGLVTNPPFRAPHHTSSVVAVVGGGSATLRPGEISLAHARVDDCYLRGGGSWPEVSGDGTRRNADALACQSSVGSRYERIPCLRTLNLVHRHLLGQPDANLRDAFASHRRQAGMGVSAVARGAPNRPPPRSADARRPVSQNALRIDIGRGATNRRFLDNGWYTRRGSARSRSFATATARRLRDRKCDPRGRSPLTRSMPQQPPDEHAAHRRGHERNPHGSLGLAGGIPDSDVVAVVHGDHDQRRNNRGNDQKPDHARDVPPVHCRSVMIDFFQIVHVSTSTSRAFRLPAVVVDQPCTTGGSWGASE